MAILWLYLQPSEKDQTDISIVLFKYLHELKAKKMSPFTKTNDFVWREVIIQKVILQNQMTSMEQEGGAKPSDSFAQYLLLIKSKPLSLGDLRKHKQRILAPTNYACLFLSVDFLANSGHKKYTRTVFQALLGQSVI